MYGFVLYPSQQKEFPATIPKWDTFPILSQSWSLATNCASEQGEQNQCHDRNVHTEAMNAQNNKCYQLLSAVHGPKTMKKWCENHKRCCKTP